MKKLLSLFLVVLLLVSLSACSANKTEEKPVDNTASQPATELEELVEEEIEDIVEESPEEVSEEVVGVEFTDDLNREVLVDNADRVAVLIGSFADIWCLAGGKDSLVAAADDTWTNFELGLSDEVKNLGAVKEPNVEVLLESEPTLVFASPNFDADVELESTLTDAGITVVYLDVKNFDDYLRVLEIMTDITGKTENYETYGTSLIPELEKQKERADGSEPSVCCIRVAGSTVKIKGTEDYMLGEMLKDLGAVNIADENPSLLEDLSIEKIIEADPQYIFVVFQGSDTTKAEEALDEALLSNPAWSELSAVKNGNYYVLEQKLYNVKPNAKWGEAYEKLADILYPEK